MDVAVEDRPERVLVSHHIIERVDRALHQIGDGGRVGSAGLHDYSEALQGRLIFPVHAAGDLAVAGNDQGLYGDVGFC